MFTFPQVLIRLRIQSLTDEGFELFCEKSSNKIYFPLQSGIGLFRSL
jgi:hypothetical protein